MFNPNLLNVLMCDTKDLKDLGFISEELDELLIPNAIQFIQDSKIQNILGTSLYQVLLSEINSKVDDDLYVIPEKYTVLLYNYIFNALGYFVQAELYLPSTNKLRNKGLLNTSDDKVTPVDYATLNSSIKYYNDRGEFYLDQLIRYIRQNITEYPEYYDYEYANKIANPVAFKSTVYFRKRCCNYTDKFDKFIK